MPINLLNDKELNDYLIELVWGEPGMPQILNGNSQENLKDAKYIEQNKDTIVRSILTQYMKHRIRAYLTENAKQSFLNPVLMRPGLPEWAVNAINGGQPVYEFEASKMTTKMRHNLTIIRDFLYSVAASYVDKMVIAIKENEQKGKKKQPKVKLEYLKTNNEYDTFDKVLAAAKKWHKHMAVLTKKKAKNEKMYKDSLSGTKFIMDLPNGMKAYLLNTPAALDYESEYMGHCVGKGAYDKYVSDGTIKIYSIRDAYGEPHATLEVRDKTVYQCKGKSDKAPVQRYIPSVQSFVQSQGFDIKHDVQNVGLIKQDGQYYSVYDLPQGFVVRGDLDLSGKNLRGVNLNIIVTGCLNLSYSSNLQSVLDFSNTKEVDLSESDFFGVKAIKGPKEKIDCSYTKHLPAVLDFSNTKDVSFFGADLSGVKEIKWPTEKVNLCVAKHLPAVLDFSNTKEVDLRHAELSGVKAIKFPTERVDLSYAKHLPAALDFSNTKEVELIYADLSGVKEIKGPTEKIILYGAKNLPAVLDFSNTKEVDLSGSDLSGVKEIKGATEKIDLRGVKLLHTVLDFSKTKEVDLRYADLSGVKEIKWPINVCHILQEDVKKMPPHIQKSYELWRANQRMNKKLKTNNNVNKIKQNLTHGMGKARD